MSHRIASALCAASIVMQLEGDPQVTFTLILYYVVVRVLVCGVLTIVDTTRAKEVPRRRLYGRHARPRIVPSGWPAWTLLGVATLTSTAVLSILLGVWGEDPTIAQLLVMVRGAHDGYRIDRKAEK